MIQPEADPQFQKPQLRTANQRVARALKQLEAMGKVIGKYLARSEDCFELFVRKDELQNGKGVRPILDWSKAPRLPATKLAIEAGEIVHHLRTALDYLVYNLAWLDSGEPQPRTQFPIEDSPKSFWQSQRRSRLRGVSDVHVNMIASFQPFSGCEWIGQLRQFSNADKHRLVVPVIRLHQGQFRIDKGEFLPHPDDPQLVIIPMKEQSTNVCLEDDSGLYETLILVACGVAGIIDLFKPDFGERDRISIRT